LITQVRLAESEVKAVQVVASAVTELDTMVESLTPEEKGLFHRLFHFSTTTGYLYPPESMRGWIEERFGSAQAVVSQKIVKITNLITFEGALFNRLRACRPIEFRENLCVEHSIVAPSDNHDPLGHPERNTHGDTFGRVEGEYCVTASNIAKYDGMHGLVIFHDYDPVSFSREKIIDYIDTGRSWAEKAHEIDPEAKYYLVMVPPPLAETEEDWEGFPVLVRLVARGDPNITTCDIGSMELFASSVISSDPWEVAWLLKESIQF